MVITGAMLAEAPQWHKECMAFLPSGVVVTLVSGRGDDRVLEQLLMSVADVGAETDEQESWDGDLAVVAFQKCESQGCGKRLARETKGGRNSVSKCSQCMLAYYCNETCQRADWHRHRAFCSKRSSRASRAREVMKRIRAEVVKNPGLLTSMREIGGLGQHDTGSVHSRVEEKSVR